MDIKNLEDALNIMKQENVLEKNNNLPAIKSDDSKINDSELAKNKLVDVLKKSNDVYEDLLDLARDTGEAKYFDVITNLLDIMRSASVNIMKIKESATKVEAILQKEKPPTTVNNTTNNIVVGTMKDIQKAIKQAKSEEIIDNDEKNDRV